MVMKSKNEQIKTAILSGFAKQAQSFDVEGIGDLARGGDLTDTGVFAEEGLENLDTALTESEPDTVPGSAILQSFKKAPQGDINAGKVVGNLVGSLKGEETNSALNEVHQALFPLNYYEGDSGEDPDK